MVSLATNKQLLLIIELINEHIVHQNKRESQSIFKQIIKQHLLRKAPPFPIITTGTFLSAKSNIKGLDDSVSIHNINRFQVPNSHILFQTDDLRNSNNPSLIKRDCCYCLFIKIQLHRQFSITA